MKIIRKLLLAAAFAGTALVVSSPASADDIDLFAGSTTSSPPNILIILDNTSNWSGNTGFPGGITQGQAEVQALANVIRSLPDDNHVGLMLLTTVSGNPGGVVVVGMQPLSQNRNQLLGILTDGTTINGTQFAGFYSNITASQFKAASSANYGAALFDAFKYFGGYTNPAHANSDTGMSSPSGRTGFGPAHYATIDLGIADLQYGYQSGVSANGGNYLVPSSIGGCGKNFILFIGNGFPNADNSSSANNVTILNDLGGNITPVQPNSLDTGGSTYEGDEWARFLYQTDVNGAVGQQNVSIYTVNVYGSHISANSLAAQAQYLSNIATASGGNYYSATNASQVASAIGQALAQMQATSSTYAAASLPVNATNRAQSENQVYIGMFRPNSAALPRWMGNLKRFQLVIDPNSGNAILGDVNGNNAVNPVTGFVAECATSYWTTDSGTYWNSVTEPGNPSLAGTCPASVTSNSPYSDSPDGPLVEKGAVAELLRNPAGSYALNRTVYTQSGSGLSSFTTTSSGLSTATGLSSTTTPTLSNLVSFIQGANVLREQSSLSTTQTRPSIHGDVIHSRPLPVTYGTNDITVFYGANDGMLRAVNAATGAERWAFLAPEFYSHLLRLYQNSPIVSYPGLDTSGISPTPQPKDYFFDGSIGLYQKADNSKVWIYPSMRRGGRTVYGLDVTNENSPAFKWKVGCPDLTDDSGCSNNFSSIGQTWSLPQVARIKGYSTTSPVVIMGGGYDTCEDANTASPSCGTPKGNRIFVVDADTGNFVAGFQTARSVAADIALVDIDNDGYVDYAYAADTGGNIYRVDFINGPTNRTPLGSSNWTMHRVAYTNGSGRKFLFPPALMATVGTTSGVVSNVYVAIGSGDREHPLVSQYPYMTPVVNRFYVYLDDLTGSGSTNLDDGDAMFDYSAGSTCNTARVIPGGSMKGWFMNLPGTGEQTVTAAAIIGGMATFSTNQALPLVPGTCSSLGQANGYWVNLFNGSGAIGVSGTCGGSASSKFPAGGLPPSPVVGIVPVNGKDQTFVIGAIQRDANGSNPASSPIAPQIPVPSISSRRHLDYWKESGDN